MPESRSLILGASGFLGSNLLMESSSLTSTVGHRRSPRAGARDSAHEVYGSLDSLEDLNGVVSSARPDIVVNCAALADVDRCELEPDLAARVNVDLPDQLATVTAKAGIRLIHISTDAVFGDGDTPCDETTTPEPINVYGATKLAGELAVLRRDPDALVLRTNIIGWSPTGRRSLLEFFVDGLRSSEKRNSFFDVRFRPVTPQQLWRLIIELVAKDVSGVVHATGRELISKADFAERVASCFRLDASLLVPTSIAAGSLTARRAATMDAEPARLKQLGIEPPDIQEGLNHLVELERSGFREKLANAL